MKNKFVIDENVIMGISTISNEKNTIDLTPCILLLFIMKNCHILLVTPKIYEKYLQKYNCLIKQSGTVTIQVLHLLNHLMSNSEKWHWEEDIDCSLSGFDPDDKIYGCLASRKHAVFATVDDKLIKNLSDLGIPKLENFIVCRPEEAISYAE